MANSLRADIEAGDHARDTMKMRLVKFVVFGLLTLVTALPLSHGQVFDGDDAGGDAAAQPDPNNIFGFGDESQQPNPEDLALVEAETERMNQEAAAKVEQGDLSAALDIYEEAIRANPNFASFLGRARILVQQEELQDAIVSYSRAAQYSGTIEDTSMVLPVFLELGQAYIDTEQFNQALAAFSAALQIPKQSRNPEVLYNIGLAQTEFALNQQYSTAQTRQEQLTQGLEFFDKAIRVDPNYAEALYERGNTHLLLGDADKALDDLAKAVEIDPDNTDAVAQLGFVSLQRGLNESGQRNGQSAKILYDLNRALEQLTRWLNIVPADQEVDEDDPEAIRRENVLLNRSAAYIGLGDEQHGNGGGNSYYQQAIQDAEAAIEIDSEKPDAFYQKGLATRMLGDLDGAIDAYTETLELSPGNPEALLRRGIAHFRQNDLELAKADFEKSIRFTPRGYNPRAYFWLGLCYQQQGEANRAVTEYTRALRLQSTFLNAYLNRGLAYMKQGRFARATADFNEVLRLDGKHPQARSLRDQSMGMASVN